MVLWRVSGAGAPNVISYRRWRAELVRRRSCCPWSRGLVARNYSRAPLHTEWVCGVVATALRRPSRSLARRLVAVSGTKQTLGRPRPAFVRQPPGVRLGKHSSPRRVRPVADEAATAKTFRRCSLVTIVTPKALGAVRWRALLTFHLSGRDLPVLPTRPSLSLESSKNRIYLLKVNSLASKGLDSDRSPLISLSASGHRA